MSEQSELDTKLFIGALWPETTSDTLRDYYEQWGHVVDAVVMHSRGFGFVTFSDKASTDRAMKALPHKIDGKVVDAKRATRKLKFSQTDVTAIYRRKIFIGGIYGKIDQQALTKYFSQFGEIKSCNIYTDEVTGDSRGFGFIIFEEEESVDLVLSVRIHVVNGIQLTVKKAHQRDDVGSSSKDNSSVASGFSSDAGSDNQPNHTMDKSRYSRRYSNSMHPRLLCANNSLSSRGSGTEERSMPVLRCDAEESNPWISSRKSVPPKSSANLKSLNEAIQAERAFSRQKIVNAEEKILELERKLILKEKECCELKEKLLYEHQRQTMEMAQGLVPSYYCEPQIEQPTEPTYTYEQSSEQSYSYEQSSEQSYSYEAAFQNGWTDYPKPEATFWTNLSADAPEFTFDMGQNSNNLISVCEAQDVLPTVSSQSNIPGTASELARNSSTSSVSASNQKSTIHNSESGYSSDP